MLDGEQVKGCKTHTYGQFGAHTQRLGAQDPRPEIRSMADPCSRDDADDDHDQTQLPSLCLCWWQQGLTTHAHFQSDHR